jgi:23S rRNA pseudouridine2605 synthase
LIREGRVTVNDNVVEQPGAVIDEEKDIVKVDSQVVEPVREKVYILLNKPKNVLTALSDPFRRKTVAHLTKKIPIRVYPVGRLDYDTEGAILLTNDGELAYRLAHPKYQIRRVYHVIVRGAFTSKEATRIEVGVTLEDGHTGRGQARVLSTGLKNSKVEITLTEGHKREIKQIMKTVGHPVLDLRRIEFAGLRIDNLKRGRWRYINEKEIDNLKELVSLKGETPEDE